MSELATIVADGIYVGGGVVFLVIIVVLILMWRRG